MDGTGATDGDEAAHAESQGQPPLSPLEPPKLPPRSEEPPPLEQPPTSVVIIEPPRQRHTALWITLAVVVVAGLGVGAYFLFRGGESTPTFSLTEAAAADYSDIPAVEYEMVIEQLGQEIEASAVYDTETELMKMTIDGAAFGMDGTVDMILDASNGIMYMAAEPFAEMGAPVDTDWISIDVADLTGGTSGECLFGATGGSPYGAASQFLDPTDVTEFDVEELDGEEVKRYEVVIDPNTQLDANPCLQEAVDQMGEDLPEEMFYEVWVTSDNTIRRYTIDFEVAGEKVRYDYTLHPLTEPAGIELPGEDEVTDFSELF